MNHRAQQHPAREWLNRHVFRHSTKIAYIGLALVVALAFYLNDRNSKADEKARCQAGTDVRNVLRLQTNTLYDLALGVTKRDTNSPPLNAYEVQQYNTYIDRLNKYRTTSYENIKPSDLCLPYVDDDNVKPPTPPAPHYQGPVAQEGTQP